MRKLVEKHALAIRWFHWINFPVLLLMMWSGLLIYWANDVYRLDWGGRTLFKFFPQPFYEALGVPFQLAKGMAWHFVLMWVFTINGVLYVTYTAVSGEWRYLLPTRHSFRDAWQTLLYDLRLRPQAPVRRKFNGAQQIAYTAVLVMGFGSLITGLAIYKPVQLSWLTAFCGGYKAARLIHFALTIGYVFFFVVHVIQVARAGWNNFRAMVAGFEVVEEPAAPRARPESDSPAPAPPSCAPNP